MINDEWSYEGIVAAVERSERGTGGLPSNSGSVSARHGD
jgi:hypothetical protein